MGSKSKSRPKPPGNPGQVPQEIKDIVKSAHEASKKKELEKAKKIGKNVEEFWQESKEKNKRMQENAMTTFQEFLSIVLEMFQTAYAMAQALHASLLGTGLKDWGLAGKLVGALGEKVGEKLGVDFTSSQDLSCDIQIDEQNKISVENAKLNGAPLPAEMKTKILNSIDKWLNQQGYQLNDQQICTPLPGSNKPPLDQQALNDLMKDPQNGLAAWVDQGIGYLEANPQEAANLNAADLKGKKLSLNPKIQMVQNNPAPNPP